MSAVQREPDMGAWFCVGVFREFSGGFIPEALPMSLLRVCHEDEAGRIFWGVFGDGGKDQSERGIASREGNLVGGFELQSAEELASGVDASGDGASGYFMEESVIGRV